MTDNFYHAFEEKYRGSRELIKLRQAVYLPFVDPVLSAYPEAGALDLGCGRGEWLELLREKGHRARGMDLDQGMLDACLELGLTVETTDAVAGLKEVPDTSLAVISAFHVVEHIPFDQLRILVEEAYRVLLPGGLLILETPNPENIVVGTASFYLDPTHHTPIPHQLLSFVSEYYGFQTVKVLRLNEEQILSDEPHLNLFSVLVGVSPDYAVVAQKGGSKKLRAKLTPFFEQEFGLSLWKMAETYHQQTEAKVEAHANKVEGKAQQAVARAEQYRTEIQALKARAEQAESRATQATAMAQETEARETATSAQLQQALEVAQRAQEKSDQAEAHAEQHRTEIQALKARAEQAESRATQADTKAQESQARETETRDQLQQALEVAQRAQEKSGQAEARAEQYQTEAQALKARTEQVVTRAEEAEWHVQELTTQLAQHQAEAQAQLQSKEQELTAKEEELEQLQAHGQWLQNEWDAAKTKIDELNHSSHHWWTVADGLNNELQSIYRSKLWRLNWPLRKLLQGIKAFIRFWRDLFVGLLRLPRRALSWLLTRAMRFVLRRGGLKNRACRWLMRHPKLEAHLRAFARQRGLLPAFPEVPSYPNPAQQQYQAVSAQTVDNAPHHGEIDLTATLSPRARQIFAELKAAVEQRRKENS
jgi:O-antigen chain-terminating methyltransferase